MVDDALLTREELSFEEYAITPQPDHLVPDSVEFERTDQAFREELGDATAVVLTHGDADGLTSAALHAYHHRPNVVAIQPVSYHGAYGFADAIWTIREELDDGLPIYVCDFNLDPETHGGEVVAVVRRLIEQGCLVNWYDHHQWDSDLREELADVGVQFTIDTDECTASIIRDALALPDCPEHIEDLVAVTKDRDLWIRDDPRSDRLATFAELADPDVYVETVLEHGPDLTDDIQTHIDRRQERDEELEAFAVAEADTYDVGGYNVGVTYVRGGRSSEIGNALVEDLGNDIAVVMKPHGGVGIYSHSDRETFARCHEIAGELGGGGHPTAAGCEVPLQNFRELADYWRTAGESKRVVLLGAVEEVALRGPEAQA